MSETSLRAGESTRADVLPNRTARRVAAVLLFAVATAIGARISVPLVPVPITLQTLFVILSGALLGPALGASSQLLYVGAGMIGLPVFAAGGGLAYLFGPTGGYLLAFPITAFLSGVVSDGARRRGLVSALALVAGLFLASLVILLGGTAWLGLSTGDWAAAFALGFLPFLVGDVLKVALAALITWRGRNQTLGWL